MLYYVLPGDPRLTFTLATMSRNFCYTVFRTAFSILMPFSSDCELAEKNFRDVHIIAEPPTVNITYLFLPLANVCGKFILFEILSITKHHPYLLNLISGLQCLQFFILSPLHMPTTN
jgi:hypothetical protein